MSDLRRLERIPLHDHSDLNSGGRVHAPSLVAAVPQSSSGIDAHSQLANVTPDQHHAQDHASRHQDAGADEISIAGLAGTSAELANHLADSSDAHDAAAVSIADAGGYFTGTDVEAALQELGAGGGGTPAAEDVTYDNTTSGLTATDVQAAIDEVAAAGGFTASLVLVASGGAAQTPGSGSVTSNLAFGTVAVDTQSGYNATNKEWTCGATGLYHIDYTFNVVSQTSGAGNHVRSFFRVAGAGVDDAGLQIMGQGATNVWQSASTTRALTSGDTIAVQGQPLGANGTISLKTMRITRLA